MIQFSQPAHSALHPASAEAVLIASLWWWMLAVGGFVWVAVVVATIWSTRPRNRQVSDGENVDSPQGSAPGYATVPLDANRERKLTRVVSALTGITAVVLLVFLALDFVAGRKLLPSQNPALVVDVAAHQWWWELTYDGSNPPLKLVTASEMHVPVGSTVQLSLHSSDVIHSVWFPNMQGKRDMIPGHESILQFRADTAGNYLGECAEFCGLQHAKMRLVLVAEPRAAFDQWLANQRASSVPPSSELTRFGQQVFTARSCSTCHTIRGTDANGHVAPDLTHIASRSTLASGAVPNTAENLELWIVAPDSIKPGTHMPSTILPAAELRALLAYLATLR